MEETEVKRLISEIAESCGDLIGEEGDFVLHVQGDGNFVATSIYHDRGTDIAYVRPDDELIELIHEFRNMLPDDQRWSLMNLVVHGIDVNAVFDYDDRAIDVGTSRDDDPRHLAAWAALGKKPIEYPLVDEGDADRDLQADGPVMSDGEIGATDRLLTYCRKLIGSDAGDFLFYMEAEEGFSSVSLYHERDGGIYWVEPDGRLFNLAEAFWNEAPASRRWYEISLVVRADGIEVRPSYGEPPDFSVDEDRRDAVIEACFGKKPVYYPDEDEIDFAERYRSPDS